MNPINRFAVLGLFGAALSVVSVREASADCKVYYTTDASSAKYKVHFVTDSSYEKNTSLISGCTVTTESSSATIKLYVTSDYHAADINITKAHAPR